jgi:phage baseplate assembly protein W
VTEHLIPDAGSGDGHRLRVAVQLGAYGDTLSGLAEVEQEIRIVVLTQRGSVPQAPEYGVDWLGMLDLPVREAVPKIALQVAEALRRLARRAHVVAVDVVPEAEVMRVCVTWAPASSGDGAERVTEVVAP